MVGLAVLAWGVRQIEPELRAVVDRRLSDSGFSVRWAHLDAHLDGTVELHELQVFEGRTALARVVALRGKLSWWALLTGRKRLSWLHIDSPSVFVDAFEGRPVAWLRLAAAWRRAADPNEPTQQRTLADRVGEIVVRGGSVDVHVLGKQVWLTGPELRWTALELAIDTSSGGQGSVTLPALLGGGSARLDVRMQAGRPQDAGLTFVPAARYIAPQVAAGAFPADLSLRVRGVRWSAHGPLSVERPHIVDLAADPSAPALVEAANLAIDGTATATLRDITWSVRQGRWFGALSSWATAHPAHLPAEWTRTSELGDLSGRMLSVHAVRSGQDWTFDAHKAVASGRDLRVGLDGLRAVVGPKGVDGTRERVEIALRAPFAEVGRRAAWFERAAPWIDRALAIRKVPDPPPADDAADQEDEPAPEAAPTVVAKPARPAAAAAPAAQRERPPQRMTRQIKELHRQILTLPARLGRRWPGTSWPKWLALDVQGARAAVLGDNGQPLIGIRGAGLRVDGRSLATSGWWAGGEPFDRNGSWGRAGMQWRRGHSDRQHLDVQLQGGGLAQVVGAHIGGLSVGDGADLDVAVAIDLHPDPWVRVEGRATVANMGIHWWRLADRPIADFAASFVFEAVADKDRLTLRTPDVRVGAAALSGSISFTQMAGNPRLALKLAAPMQDCGAMLRAIPPSLLPTVGTIEAHGVLDWHVGLDVAFPNVGAVAVDLALGDTWCTVDKLGGIDFDEFKGTSWVRPVNENGRILNDVLIGPGSGSWTSTMNMPGYVHYVMWATEDPFLKHRGISEDLLAKAIAIDLATGRFTYGGSTLTQQLVKNLYLRRTKALSRKFEEMIIVWQMEKALGKARILEIYVNAVEFGPRVYGITRAAWEFFQKRPAELRPKEAVYLAIIKPSPRSGWGTMRANGWGDWYEAKTAKYMDKLLRDESITPEQYEADKPWKPAFNPAPRGIRPLGR